MAKISGWFCWDYRSCRREEPAATLIPPPVKDTGRDAGVLAQVAPAVVVLSLGPP